MSYHYNGGPRRCELMGSVLIAAYLVLAGLAVVQAVLAAVQTWEHRRFARSRVGALCWYRPPGRAVLLVPCRGSDLGLEENLHELFLQDHRNYEVWFILESPNDPVYATIRRAVEGHPEIDCRLIFAGRAGSSGQKVHNLRVATAQLPPEAKYLAFVDCDARPSRHWLRGLLMRLDEPGVGAATGYRWFVPQRPSLVNLLLYSMNCNLAVFLGNNAPNFVWGGSWAIRRDVFQRLRIREAWQGTLSDDLVASRVLRQAGLRVEFEPASMVESPLDCTFPEMASFARRQFFIGRFYVPLFWALCFVLISFANLAFWGSFGAAVWGLLTGRLSGWLPAGVCGFLYVASVYRGMVRQDLGQIYFPHLYWTLRRARRFDIWAGPLVSLANWLELSSALFGRHITWRGITYRLFRGGQIRLVRRDDPAALPDLEVEPIRPTQQGVIQPPTRYRKAG